MYAEDDLIQISALQHYVYCPRQCALIHVEDVWRENVYTVRGDILHDRADTDTHELRGTVRTVRGLRIHSLRLGISGRADVVEFRNHEGEEDGLRAVPVEYKAGEPKQDISDEVQLCAQALCLEEMLGRPVPLGEFFYGKIRRRVQVDIDGRLRERTEQIIDETHALIGSKRTPAAEYAQRCRHCSLADACMPMALNRRKLYRYLESLYRP